ncbi:MAG: hypothetical protein MJ025_01195 [Victivallaceae bacterium]|nr:hypothetical protein [Victivallaceae bacterium]
MPAKKEAGAIGAKAKLDFVCVGDGCDGVVEFDLSDIASDDFQMVCPKCHKAYCLSEDLHSKLSKMLDLMVAIRNAEGILGDCFVSVNTKMEEIRIPYSLLLTRLNTIISLDLGERKVNFHLRVEPSSEETFR